jgi:hypothetical protein
MGPSNHRKWRAWHVLPRTNIIGPTFFNTINNLNVYTDIFQDCVNLLYDRELTGHFQQYRQRCHASNQPWKQIRRFFEDRIKSKQFWQARYPDMTPHIFFFPIDDYLERNNTKETSEIRSAMLAATFANTEHRVDKWKTISAPSLVCNYLHLLEGMHSLNFICISKLLCGFWLFVQDLL